MGELLSPSEILAADDITTERVEVPEWGGDVLVRAMSGKEKDAWETSLYDDEGTMRKGVSLRASILAKSLVTKTGEYLFTDPAEIEALGLKSTKALDRIFAVAKKLSKVTDKDIAEMEDFSKPGPDSDTTSSSHDG
jgi:hypothetical protein